MDGVNFSPTHVEKVLREGLGQAGFAVEACEARFARHKAATINVHIDVGVGSGKGFCCCVLFLEQFQDTTTSTLVVDPIGELGFKVSVAVREIVERVIHSKA